MFEQTFVDTQTRARQPWTMAASATGCQRHPAQQSDLLVVLRYPPSTHQGSEGDRADSGPARLRGTNIPISGADRPALRRHHRRYT